MFARVMIALLACVLGAASLQATPREELIFKINTALKTRDGAGFAQCFNFRGSDESTRQSLIKTISQILAWPGVDVSVSDRNGQGKPKFDQDGRSFTLNGDWKYQMHIFPTKNPKAGFVFPAGPTAGGEDLILVTVPEKTAAAKSP